MAARGKVCLTGPSRLRVAEEALRSAGCERMQGYFFARPMSADAVEALLQEENGAPLPLAVAS